MDREKGSLMVSVDQNGDQVGCLRCKKEYSGRTADKGGVGGSSGSPWAFQIMQYEPFHAELTMDPKGRVMLPVQPRMALRMEGTNQLIAVANEGSDGGLSLFDQRIYRDLLAERTARIDPFDPYSPEMLFLRSVVSTNHTLTIDGNGRVVIPPRLRTLAGLDGRLLMFSMGTWIEIWNVNRWNERHPQLVRRWLDTRRPSPASKSSAESESQTPV
ncbi:MAG: MraZ protein [Myxococcota bacterium]|jgi:MraZ protein